MIRLKLIAMVLVIAVLAAGCVQEQPQQLSDEECDNQSSVEMLAKKKKKKKKKFDSEDC